MQTELLAIAIASLGTAAFSLWCLRLVDAVLQLICWSGYTIGCGLIADLLVRQGILGPSGFWLLLAGVMLGVAAAGLVHWRREAID